MAEEENVQRFIDAINDTLARKLLVTADFYRRTGHPVAAVYTYREVVQVYPNTKESRTAEDACARCPRPRSPRPRRRRRRPRSTWRRPPGRRNRGRRSGRCPSRASPSNRTCRRPGREFDAGGCSSFRCPKEPDGSTELAEVRQGAIRQSYRGTLTLAALDDLPPAENHAPLPPHPRPRFPIQPGRRPVDAFGGVLPGCCSAWRVRRRYVPAERLDGACAQRLPVEQPLPRGRPERRRADLRE